MSIAYFGQPMELKLSRMTVQIGVCQNTGRIELNINDNTQISLPQNLSMDIAHTVLMASRDSRKVK